MAAETSEHCCSCAQVDIATDAEKSSRNDSASEWQATLQAAIQVTDEAGEHASASRKLLAALFDSERRKIELAGLPRL